ncbi:MAG: ABC transporter ATP-binding protein [Spirochaetota bacterium]|nr:ABC transporter ATP-binding protein [Spirochaetota bacterium]
MLVLNNIEVKYQNVILVLRGVTIEVPDGHVVSLLGANGAGKSTVIKAVSGMLYPEEGRVTDGSIEYNGVRIDGMRTTEIVNMGIVQVMEGRRTLEQLTTEENLVAGAIGQRPSRAELKKNLDRVYDLFPRLKDVRNQTAGYLSGGEQQQVVVGRGLMSQPKVMLLDEASLGLAPMLVKEIYNIIERLNKEEKISLLVVEQNARAALAIADYGYVMENGRVVLDDTGPKLIENEDIKEFYMGLTQVGDKKSYKTIKHYKRRKRWLG